MIQDGQTKQRGPNLGAQLTNVIPRYPNGHLCDLPRFITLQPHLSSTRILTPYPIQRLGDDLPQRPSDGRRILFPNGIPQLHILLQPTRALVQPKLRIRDLQRHFMQQAQQEVGRLRVEGRCRVGSDVGGSRVSAQEVEEVGEKSGSGGGIGLEEEERHEV